MSGRSIRLLIFELNYFTSSYETLLTAEWIRLSINNHYTRCSPQQQQKYSIFLNFLLILNLQLWRKYMPSDKNNYIVIIRDPSSFKQCFPFSNPSRIDKSTNLKVTPLLLPLPMLFHRDNQRFYGNLGVFIPIQPQKIIESFLTYDVITLYAVITTVQKSVW